MKKIFHNFWLGKIQPKIVRFLLFITKGEILYISFAAFITVFIAIWIWLSKQDVSNAIELSTFSAVVLEGGLVALVGLLRSRVQNYTEDSNKLTSDYSDLVKRYSSEYNFVWSRNADGISVIPVIHTAWLYDKSIVIEDHPENEYRLPDIIDQYYDELFKTHQTSKIYNNINIRMDDWYVKENVSEFKMITGRTNYYNSLVTNRAMDYELDKGISVREVLECGPMVHPLKYSKLSNHLGFNGFVESSDGEIILVFRKKNVSIGKRTYANSVGASLKASYALNGNFLFTEEGLETGIVREIEDELCIPEDALLPWDEGETGVLGPIKFIAAYRDMLEGGKPQLLFYVRASLDKRQIADAFSDKVRRENHCHREMPEQEMETDGDKLYWIERDKLKDCDVYADKIRYQGFNMQMLPPAAACVAMFIQFLNKGAELNHYNMPVRESYVHGKYGGAEKCEDAIFCGERFVAVIDGVTAKGQQSYYGKSSGRYAAEVIVKEFSKLDHSKIDNINSTYFVLQSLDRALKTEMDKISKEYDMVLKVEDYLRASVIYYDRQRKEVVNYGDCKCRIDEEIYNHSKKMDEELSEMRAKTLQAMVKEGAKIESLRSEDPGRKAIFPQLLEQLNYENQFDDKGYGYPVLNGHGINDNMVSVYPIFAGQKVILCSDGYPKICGSLQESEYILKKIIEEDPLLINQYKSTKGCALGADSYDDRAWIMMY